MNSFLAKYDSGMHRGVWSELTELGSAVVVPPIHDEALAIARKTMQRIAVNLQRLVDRLGKAGFEFVNDPITPPSANIGSAVESIESIVGPIPLSLRAWWEVIGGVDFRARHLSLCWYSDALVVYSGDHGLWQAKEWEATCEIDGIEETGPFEFVIAPDCLHKDDISGGDPYRMLPSASMDAVLRGEPHHCLFIEYIRICLASAGYPGFALQGLRTPDALTKASEELLAF
jgi:hypothetical protein